MNAEEFKNYVESIAATVTLDKPYMPDVSYSHAGRCLYVYLTRDPYYGEYINPNLTLFRSQETKEIVGMEIGGIAKLMKEAEEKEAAR